jgi:oxygen-independent coproporphyrinogen-3 oxidase
MNSMTRWTARTLRRYLAGPDTDFVLRPTTAFAPPVVMQAGLYLHIPFCRSLCPYCPYDRIAYDRTLVEPYAQAVLAELAMIPRGAERIQSPSLYIGGGTPTTMLDQLGPMLDGFRRVFDITGEVALETTVGDITSETVARLRAIGVSVLSLGVQSFDDGMLRTIGRTYSGDAAHEAVVTAQAGGFESISIDLMFCLPGQTVQDVLRDLEIAVQMDVDQVTCYPLFSFSYSIAGNMQGLPELLLPPLRERHAMYHAIHAFFVSRGYRRVSVWGFKKGCGPRYSSVTRDDYLGFGTGAGSHVQGLSWFNTFSVPEYMAACGAGRSPAALSMEFTPAMERSLWLYWRLYETSVGRRELWNRFLEDRGKIRLLLETARCTGLIRTTGDRLDLTERGAFWIHLLQNEVALRAVDRIWGTCLRKAWPDRIQL